MTRDDEKRSAAERALKLVEPGMVVGVGTGSTVAFFIEGLAKLADDIEGAVASSEATSQALKRAGIRVLELNHTGDLPLYVDGADEVDPHRRLIKGGGGALSREKVIAAASRQFICIVDSAKTVDLLGTFPLPIEVLPMARSFVARQLVRLGGQPVWREAFVTDNGNAILDLHNLRIVDPLALEQTISMIPGVVTVGLFAKRPADKVYVGDSER